MKKLALFVVVTILLSCSSSDENNALELSNSELLILNSPWKLTHEKVIEITDQNGTGVTLSDIQNTTSYNELYLWLFNDDGTGTTAFETLSGDTVYSNFTWSIVENKLRIDDEIAESFTINNNEFTVTSDGTLRLYQGEIIRLKTKLFFNKHNI